MNSIRKYRLQKNLTQKQLGEKMGIKQSTVAMWESGKNLPRTSTLKKLSEVFDVPIEFILENEQKGA